MRDEEKLYMLMAQAEKLQDETIKIFREAEKASDEIVRAMRDTKKQVAKQTFLGSVLLFCVAIIMATIMATGAYFYLGKQKEKITALEEKIATMQTRAEEWKAKAGRAELSVCGDTRRLCVRVDSFSGEYADGKKIYRIIHGY